MTADEALQQALAWAEGRMSWTNSAEPGQNVMVAIADAAQAQAWAALSVALRAAEADTTSTLRSPIQGGTEDD